MNLRYTERAKSDIDVAFEWYEEQSRGLGGKFLDSLELSINNILQYPEMYEKPYSNFHRSILDKFPFPSSTLLNLARL